MQVRSSLRRNHLLPPCLQFSPFLAFAAPLLELASILASRGHLIEFGTLAEREAWLVDWPFVSCLHVLGPPVLEEVEEASYLRISSWSSDLTSNWASVFAAKQFLESSWLHAYRSLTRLMLDPATLPDFILADYLVDAARDMSLEHDIPLAMHWPQMPTAMLPASYIPGTPGLQIEVLTSEFATVLQRLWSAVAIYTSLPHYLRYLRWLKRMRASIGVSRQLPTLTKPDYLCLVNSFFGLEAAKDLPPNVAAIGPVLSDRIPALNEPFTTFLGSRSRVLYVALGTHVLLSHQVLFRLLSGAVAALASGVIDGIIWPIRYKARNQLDPSAVIAVPAPATFEGQKTDPVTSSTTVCSLLNNSHPSILFVEFAPQRALLHDARVAIFFSHAGASSTNEAAFAGVPLITLPVYFDQIQNAMRLRDAGVSVPLQKENFTAHDVSTAISSILDDRQRDGPIATNVRRVRGIAKVAARRKHLGADLIEEVMADWGDRRRERQLGVKRPRGMHLQTADARMPVWKARNWDLWGLVGTSTFVVLAGVVFAIVVPLLRHSR